MCYLIAKVIEGEIKIGEYPVWVNSPATVLEEEFYHTDELYCRIDNVEGNIIECPVPVRMFVSPFLKEYSRYMKDTEDIFSFTQPEPPDMLPSSLVFDGWADIEESNDIKLWENLLAKYTIPRVCKEQLFRDYPSLIPGDTIFYIELSRDKYEQYVNSAAISSGQTFRNFGTGWYLVRQIPEKQSLKKEADKDV